MVPCCMIGTPDVYEIGKSKSIVETWNSQEYQDFRQAHLDGKPPEACKQCYLERNGH